jgi:hypothetical protein
VVDQSQPPLFFAAVLGIGEILDHCLSDLEGADRDVSPVVFESRRRIVVVNLYEPEPVTVQIVQHDEGPLERTTEVLGAGFGLGVLAELRRTTRILDLVLTPMTDHFCRRLANETATYVQTYALFRGDEREKKARFAQVLRGLQARNRRETNLLRQLL